MHDGSMKTLDEVLTHYSQGGKHPKNQDVRIKGFSLSSADRDALKSFLSSLTDTSFLTTIYGKKSLVLPPFYKLTLSLPNATLCAGAKSAFRRLECIYYPS
jgi:hypothetical protein